MDSLIVPSAWSSREANIGFEGEWHYEALAKSCIRALKRNNIGAYYASDRNEAKQKCLELIPEDATTIGIGDSVSLHQIGIVDEVTGPGRYEVFNPFHYAFGRTENDERDPSRVARLMRQAVIADVFLSGTNAVILDGRLVNADSHGNRLAGIIFGPQKVIVVVGANKIVANLDEAMKRIRNVATPMNVRRHVLKHERPERPCSLQGRCVDASRLEVGLGCRTPDRMCNLTLIIEHQPEPLEGMQPRLNVIIVGETLGF